MTPTTARPASARLRTAEVLSEVFGPAPLLTVLFVQAGIASGTPGGWWAALPVIGIAMLPYLAMIRLARGKPPHRAPT